MTRHTNTSSAADFVGAQIAEHVPDKSHYQAGYLRGGRIFSFANQIKEVLSFEPTSVLEVGPGPKIVYHTLKVAGVDVRSLDIESSLEPDILGSVTDIPRPDGEFDVVTCCQVLEHLPFDRFVPALKEMRRVSRVGCVMSLPDVTRCVGVECQLPLIGRRSFAFHIGPGRNSKGASKREQMNRDGHFWEIGLDGVSRSTIEGAIADAGWRLRRRWRNLDMPWHHFFSLGV